jgi:hypothetical protein
LERTGFEPSRLIASSRSGCRVQRGIRRCQLSFGAYQSLKGLFVVGRSCGSAKGEQDKHQAVPRFTLPRFMQRLPRASRGSGFRLSPQHQTGPDMHIKAHLTGLDGSNPVRSSSQSGTFARLSVQPWKIAALVRVCASRRAPENGPMSATRAILGNFSLLVREPGPIGRFL